MGVNSGPYRTAGEGEPPGAEPVFCSKCRWLVEKPLAGGPTYECRAPGNMKPTWLELAPSDIPHRINHRNDCTMYEEREEEADGHTD
jgi:hypothetical protein